MVMAMAMAAFEEPDEHEDEQMNQDTEELLHMFAAITTTDRTELVQQFAYLLELDETTATFFLESSNWNLELAANNLFGTMGEMRFESALQANQAASAQDNPNTSAQMPQAKLLTNLSYLQTSVFGPRDRANMTWVFENPGPLAWPEDTALCFFDGHERFEMPDEMYVAAAAGSQIVVNVALTMPNSEGSFSGSWRLRSAQCGGFFGDPVWVACTVQDSKSRQLFKMQEPHIQASQIQHQSQSHEYLPASHVHLARPTSANQEDQLMEVE